jgi:tRNA-dihydrouridine synthase
MIHIGNISLPDFPLLLAPMEDVSDPPFRAVCKDNGADLMYTEFISSEGLIRTPSKANKSSMSSIMSALSAYRSLGATKKQWR